MGKIKRSFEMLKISLNIIKNDKELLVYSFISFLASIAILITFCVAWFFSWIFEENVANQEIYIFLFWFSYYLIFFFITYFFNTAIITSVQRIISWQENNFWDWLRDASKNVWKIFIWSLVSALVTMILKFLQEKFWENSLIWRIIFGLIGWVWSIMTFFAFPLMILENKWVKDSIKESSWLFKKTWWERASLHIWIWLITFFLALFVAVILLFLAFLSGNEVFAVSLAWIFIIFAIILWILTSTCETILKVILLNYAKTWNLPKEMEDKKEILEF